MIAVSSLPAFRRDVPSFEDLFDVPAEETIRKANEASDDPVCNAPRLPIDLAEVGYRQAPVLVQITDPFGTGESVQAVCAVTIATAVPRRRRGIHMSRLGDALASSTREPYADLTSFATRLAGRLGDCQYGGPTTVRIAATVPYLEEVPANARGTSKTSLEHLNLLVTATVEGRRPPDVRAGVRVDHIVACPCVQQTYKHALMSQRRQLDAHDVSPYALTHSQRCTTTLMARGFDGAFPATNVLRALDAVIVRCMNTLPRAAELAMVFRAHRQPQFIEDALRESLWAFYRGLGAPSSVRVVHGYAKSSESIHEFDLFAKGRLVPGRSAVLERAIHQRERGDHVSND